MSQGDPVDPWADVDPAVVVTGTPMGERSGDVGTDGAATTGAGGVSRPGPGGDLTPTRPRRRALLLGALGTVAVALTIASAVAFANRPDEFGTPGAVALTGEPAAESSAEPENPRTPDPAAPSPSATPVPTVSPAGPVRQADAATASPRPTSPAASEQPPADAGADPVLRAGLLASGASGRCLTGAGELDTVVLYDCRQRPRDQRWEFHSDGTVRVRGLCLDLRDGSTANGAQVILAGCSGAPSQQFHLNSVDDLYHRDARKCVDVYDGRQDNGAVTILWPCSGAAHQSWYLK